MTSSASAISAAATCRASSRRVLHGLKKSFVERYDAYPLEEGRVRQHFQLHVIATHEAPRGIVQHFESRLRKRLCPFGGGDQDVRVDVSQFQLLRWSRSSPRRSPSSRSTSFQEESRGSSLATMRSRISSRRRPNSVRRWPRLDTAFVDLSADIVPIIYSFHGDRAKAGTVGRRPRVPPPKRRSTFRTSGSLIHDLSLLERRT